MRKTLSVTVLLLSIVIMTSGKRFTMTITCQPCTITCGVTNCLRLTGPNGYDQQQCSTSNCDPSVRFNLDFDSCTQDSNGTACYTGICYYGSSLSLCGDYSGLNCVTNSFTSYIKCGTCSKTNCRSCTIYSYNISSVPTTEQCFTGSCSDFSNMTVVYEPCKGKVDSNGNICSCCLRSVSSSQVGYCTSGSSVYGSGKFTEYALKTTDEALIRPSLIVLAFIMLVFISTTL